MTDTAPFVAPFSAYVDRDVVVIAGPDATSFLQSLVSQDLDPVAVGETVHSLLLQPQGKLLADFTATRVAEDEWWFVCERGIGAALADGLGRFKIRVKAEIHARSESVLAVRGAPAPAELPDGVRVVSTGWGGVTAYDAIGDEGVLELLRSELVLPLVDAGGYERARIEAGVPRQGADTDDRTIPQEAGLERDAVSFTKGCFVGQELVCRIDTRGHVNRYLRRVRTAPDATPVAVGDPVALGDKDVGEITSSAGDVALAMLRREVEPGAVVRVGAVSATVEALA
jgi:hypothetical protein